MLTLAIVASGLAAFLCLIGAELSISHGWVWETGFAAASIVFALLSIRAAIGSARTSIGGDVHAVRRAWSKMIPLTDHNRQKQDSDQNSANRSPHL